MMCWWCVYGNYMLLCPPASGTSSCSFEYFAEPLYFLVKSARSQGPRERQKRKTHRMLPMGPFPHFCRSKPQLFLGGAEASFPSQLLCDFKT